LVFTMNPAAAQTGGNYDLGWNTWDGGGGTSSGGTYEISGTIGQPDTVIMSGGNYTLSCGFWPGVLTSATPQIQLNAWCLY